MKTLPKLTDRSASQSSEALSKVRKSASPKLQPFHVQRTRGTLETLSTDEGRRPAKVLSPRAPLLARLRLRDSADSVAVTPDLASRVVKDYLLPLFEADARTFASQHRKSMCNSTETLQSLPGTVYGELKLSDQLKAELEETRGQLNHKARLLLDAEQSRASLNSAYAHLQQLHLEAQSAITLLHYQLTLTERNLQQIQAEYGERQQQFSQLQVMYDLCDAEKKVLTSALHEEKAKNDKLKNRATELEQGNSLMKMENDVMGERLKGLYAAIDDLCEVRAVGSKIDYELQTVAEGMRSLAEFNHHTRESLSEALETKDQLINDCREMNSLRAELKAEKEKLAVLSRERITSLSQELAALNDKLEATNRELQSSEKLYKDLEDEHTKLRTKMKQYRLKRMESEVKDAHERVRGADVLVLREEE